MYTNFQQNRLVDHSKRCTQIYLQIIASCIILQLSIVIMKKIIISERHHRITYVYINFLKQIRVNIDQSKLCSQINLQIIASCINLQLPIVILKKLITLDVCQSITCMYTNFQKNRVSIDQSKSCTQSYLQKILSCINMQLTIQISKPIFFQTCIIVQRT